MVHHRNNHFLLTGLLLSAILPVTAEIRPFDLVLPPTEAYIHYTDGYLRAPGYIDISGLTFEAIGESFGGLGDDAVGFEDMGDDRIVAPPDEDEMGGPPHHNRALEGGYDVNVQFMVDVAVFQQPDKCAKRKNGCDWTKLGVGAKTADGTLRWCCSQDAISKGMCTDANVGRLILQPDIFNGTHRWIDVPYTGPMKKTLKYGRFEERENSGRYVVVFSNCDEEGRDIHVTGQTVWKSMHGFLPGQLYGFMYFYGILTAIYAVLLCWYGSLMHFNKASRIPIEKWILMTITMGMSEMVFRSSDYVLWNTNGSSPMLFAYSGIIVGVLKRGVSRVLMVMVSLGWGVIRDSLGATMNSVLVLGASYIGVSAFRDLMIKFADDDISTLSYEEEVELFDIVTILTFVLAAIDVIFILWILDALNGTMQYLENMSQMRKLQRYLSLRSILLFSILFATIWVVFSLVDNYDEDGIVREEHEWVVEAATEVNYLYVLIGISILWRPNPSAQEYAYVMELPASGGDDGETELELSGVVPSAMDDDDADDPPAAKMGSGYEQDERFKIDEAEAT